MKKNLTLLILLLFMLSLVTAIGCSDSGFVGDGKLGDNFTLIISCPTCDFINFTLTTPSKNVILNNVQMVQNGNNFEYLILGSNLTEVGTYYGNGGDNNSPLGFCFDITKTGEELTQADSNIYIIMTVSMLFFFLFIFVLMLFVPYKNEYNEKGMAIKVCKGKYVKIFLIGLSFLLFIWFLNVLIAVSDNFLVLTQYYGFISFIFILLNNLALPFGIFLIVLSFFEIIRDVNFNKRIEELTRLNG